jgi:glucokinase
VFQVFYVDFSADNSVRMAIAAPRQRPPAPYVCICKNREELDAEIGAFLTASGHPQLIGAALSVCGWERDGVFEMPNLSYSIDRDWIRTRLGVSRVHLVNDIVAAALAIDLLHADELIPVYVAKGDPNHPKAVVALGRSLGTTTLTADEFGAAMATPSAGGHCDLAATTEREFAVIRYLSERFGHVSRVRALSTQGLVNVYDALADIDGAAVSSPLPQTLIGMAREGDARAAEAVELVLGWLAATASDTVLAVGARGGMYLAGSFFTLVGDLFDAKAFAARFTAKGRLSEFLAAVPVFIVTAADPEMIGLSTLFTDR